MTMTWRVPTADLRLHPRAEEIPTMDPDAYDEFIKEIEVSGIRVPLDVLPMLDTDGRHARPDEAAEIIVIDGRHRLRAAKTLGIEEVEIREVEVVCWHNGDDLGFGLEECPSHAFEYMVKASTMRRHLTTQQRKSLAATVIITDPKRSDRSIASATGISRPTVAKVREELVLDGQVATSATSTGTDGKAYPRTDSSGRKQPVGSRRERRLMVANAKARHNRRPPTWYRPMMSWSKRAKAADRHYVVRMRDAAIAALAAIDRDADQ